MLLAALGALLLYHGPLFDIKQRSASWIREFPERISGDAVLKKRIEQLEAENAFLRNKLGEPQTLTAIKVYSSYPFTTRGELAIAAGERDGVAVGDAVVVSGNILVGRVRKVFSSSAIVTTIFDPSWEIAVRVGEKQIDALFKGGNEPTLTLVPKDDPLNVGERIITAGVGIPYGLEIGSIADVRESRDGVFKEAVVEPSFQINEIRDVAVYR